MIETENFILQRRLRSWWLGVGGWQIKGKCRSIGRSVFKMEQAAVFFHYGVADRQAQARSSRLGCKIRIENSLQILLGNAPSGSWADL